MGHSFTKLLFHCVFSTKDKRALLKGKISDKINAYMAGVAKNHGAHLIRAGGTPDHRHLLLELKPTTNVCDIMRFIKTNSSKWLHEEFPEAGAFGWQTGYSAFSVSESARQKVVAYIDDQMAHHSKMSFDQELKLILDRHRVDYDPAQI